MSKVQLLLANSSGVFYPGNQINGTIQCYFNSEKNFRAIKIQLYGKEETQWVERESYYDDHEKRDITRDVTYTGENKFLDEEYKIIAYETTLPPGIHNYPFSFTLPNDLPSTFDTSNGNIQYKIKVVVDRPCKTDYEDSMHLKIISPLDLNKIPDLNKPYEMSDDKNMWCLCCKSGPLTMTVNLPRRGYAAGENIDFSVHVENLSNISVESLKFTLSQEIEIKTNNPQLHSKTETNYIGEVTERGVGAHGDYVFPLSINIPDHFVPSNFTCCQLFKVSYNMKCKAICPSPHSNLSFYMSLMIGHIGIGSLNTFIQPAPSITAEYPITAPVAYPNTIPFPSIAPYPAETPYPTGTPYPSGVPYSPGAPYPTVPPYPAGAPDKSATPYPAGAPYPPSSFPYPPGSSGPPNFGFTPPSGPSAPLKNNAYGDDFIHPKGLEGNTDAGPPSAPFPPPPSYNEALQYTTPNAPPKE